MILHFVLDYYFAAVLAVAGIAKLEHPNRFVSSLRQYRIFPPSSIRIIGYSFPWIEIVLAGVLSFGILTLAADILVFLLFGSFLIIKGILFVTKHSTGCGCFGDTYTQSVSKADVLTSTLFLLLAALHLFSGIQESSMPLEWNISIGFVFCGIEVWLISKTVLRAKRENISFSPVFIDEN